MSLLLSKLRVVELENKLKVDFWLKIGIYSRKNCPRHGSRQLPPANSWLVVRWRRPDVFNVIFEINRHLFLVFLLLTLNVVFLAKYVVNKVTWLQPIILQKRDSTWNFSWVFQLSQLERVWMTFKLSNNKLHHWYLLSILIKF